MAKIEDDFSDPDDAPLDPTPLPPPRKAKGNSAGRPPPSLPTQPAAAPQGYRTVDPSAIKDWSCIYPISIDAKRPHTPGARRVSKAIALEWPIAQEMAKACVMLGLEAVFEPNKCHPKDWANPGRVRVLLKKDGVVQNPRIKDKTTLLKLVCARLASSQPKAPTATADDPHPLPPIHLRLAFNSPAISQGILESAMTGGGPMGAMGGMFGNMLGGGAAEEPEEVPVVKKAPPLLQKQKKLHIKRR